MFVTINLCWLKFEDVLSDLPHESTNKVQHTIFLLTSNYLGTDLQNEQNRIASIFIFSHYDN